MVDHSRLASIINVMNNTNRTYKIVSAKLMCHLSIPYILKTATDYYKTLFGPSNSPNCKLDPLCWSPEEKVSQEESELLDSTFSEDEIKKNVVFSMEKNTAPGPDHIPVEFFSLLLGDNQI